MGSVYYLHVFQDGDGQVLRPAEVLQRLAAVANAPIYGHVDRTLVVELSVVVFIASRPKGKVRPIWDCASWPESPLRRSRLRQPARMPPCSIGVRCRRRGISEDRLPPGSIVRNKVPSFWELYRWHIVGVISLCVLETLMIAGLLVQTVNLPGRSRLAG